MLPVSTKTNPKAGKKYSTPARNQGFNETIPSFVLINIRRQNTDSNDIR